jgi:arylsulfatase
MHDSVSLRPDRPFFMYLAFGATHAPHQAPESYLRKYRGAFDEGWDVFRERWFARQKELGVIPADTTLAPRNPGVEAWDDLSENQKRLACRLQEAYAAFLEHTDDQIGRLLSGLKRLGVDDNTVIFLMSDNGASQEGGPFGVLHEMKFFNMILETPDEAIARIEEIGGPHSHSNYPWGWSQAGNTPFKWYKQNTHEGGIHVPCIVRWPNGVTGRGELRDQFHHVNDIVPTILEITGVSAPSTYRGLDVMPISGTSMKYAMDDASATTRKKIQYYEMGGHRGIHVDGWKAVTRHVPGTSFDEDVWELYHVDVDRSETNDLAHQEPDRLRELIALWWEEAEREGVLPLDDRGLELFGAKFADRSVHPMSRTYVYRPPMAPMPAQAAASLGGRSWDMDAYVNLERGRGGVLYASGTENSGFSFYVDGNRLVFDYNIFGDHHVLESNVVVPAGNSVLSVRFRRDGKQGLVSLQIDGADAGSLQIPFVMRTMSSVGPSVAYDHGSPVAAGYAHRRDGYPFEGDLDRIEIRLISPRDTGDVAESSRRQAMGRQ